MTVTLARFDELAWTAPTIPADFPDELRPRAEAVRRKGLAAGEAGFHASHVTMPAGQVTTPHSHDHGELIVILGGSLLFDDGDGPIEVRQHDAVSITAGHVYGFEVGPDGVAFLLVRGAKATSSFAPTPTPTPAP